MVLDIEYMIKRCYEMIKEKGPGAEGFQMKCHLNRNVNYPEVLHEGYRSFSKQKE